MKFKSKIYITKKNRQPGFDTKELFQDLHKVVDETKEKLGWVKLPRHFKPQTVLNRTSAGYISSTAMKSFKNCPGMYLYSMLTRESKQSATYIGTSVHTVMERFYKLENNLRDEEHYRQIVEGIIKEDEIEGSALSTFNYYIDGFWTAPDYIRGPNGEEIPMNHKEEGVGKELEYFVRDSFHPFGVNLSKDPEHEESLLIYDLIDRIDIRNIDGEEKVFIIDYKTGMGNARSYNLGQYGYLPQMIFYKWAVEKVFNKPVEAVYLMLPGADDNDNKWVKMNASSLVEQSRVVESIVKYLKFADTVRKEKFFPWYQDAMYNDKELKEIFEDYKLTGEAINPKTNDNSIDIEFEIDERDILETALDNEMITFLPDEVQTIDQWNEYAAAQDHLVEEDYILNDEKRIIRSQASIITKLTDGDNFGDDDW